MNCVMYIDNDASDKIFQTKIKHTSTIISPNFIKYLHLAVNCICFVLSILPILIIITIMNIM